MIDACLGICDCVQARPQNRVKSGVSEIRCQFIILARKDEPTRAYSKRCTDTGLPPRGKPFAAARQAYQATVQQAITEASAGTLSSETVQAVRAAADQLYIQFQQTPSTDREEWGEAKAYLQTLLNISRELNKPAIERILAKVLPTPQVTVGDLLSFMHTSHLRFGPALTPEQLAAYEELYPLFAAARDQIFKEAGVAATVPPPAALAKRNGHR